jgi:DNA-binding transcriptional regulator YhcF (GntR family)
VAEVLVNYQYTDALSPNAPAALRALTRFVLRAIDTISELMQGDIAKALIWSAIWSANVKHLVHTEANTRYGALDTVPPDELRKPVSVLALANSLRLPYETTRRCTAALVREGHCVRVKGQGLLAPAATLEDPRYVAAVRSNYAHVVTFVAELDRSGFDFGPFRTRPSAGAVAVPEMREPANMRAILRVQTQFVMRVLEILADAHGNDLLSTVVFNAVCAANVAHMTDPAPGNSVDGALRPVTVRAIANCLRLPYETTRRYIGRLEREGKCVRAGGHGLVVSTALWGGSQSDETSRSIYKQLLRFASDLQRAGFMFASDENKPGHTKWASTIPAG